MRIKNWILPIVIFAVFWGGIGLSMAAGVWHTKISASEIHVNSVEDIKGWMTLENLSEYTGLPVGELKKVLELPENTGHNKRLKVIAEEEGVEVEEFRMLLDKYIRKKGI